MRGWCGKNVCMEWIYLSPHLDDAALSCGGLIWEQVRSGDRVGVLTICAGDPPAGEISPFARSLHERWGTESGSMVHRRTEDLASCAVLGAQAVHLPIRDCIYRQDPSGAAFLYDSEESLTGSLHPADQAVIQSLRVELQQRLPEQAFVVCPLAIGDHVDHHLTRAAAERLSRPLYYYVDYPYVIGVVDGIQGMSGEWRELVHPISEAGLHAWQEAVASHASQISTFWGGEADMRRELRAYCERTGGVSLWKGV